MATLLRAACAAGLCLCAATMTAGCASAPPKGIYATPAGLGQFPYSDADIEFMSGMIPHHAQAVIMAGWAPSHGARKDVAILCERIVVGQRDEIALMQTVAADRGLPVPDAKSTRHKMKMNGVEHDMLMPGMLTDEEMAALDEARGPEFDRLFLDRHDQAPPGRDRHGRRAASSRTARRRTRRCSSSRTTSTPTSRSRSTCMQKMLEDGRHPE